MSSSAHSLKRRSVRAGAWTGGGHALSQVLRLAGNLILTRLLMPEAFGLMAVVMTLLMALELLSDIGSGTVVVQSERGAEEDFLNTAWTLQIIRGALLWLVGLGIAGGIKAGQAYHWFSPGTVYDDPMLPALVAASTFSMVIYGLVSLNAKLAQRNLDLKTLSIVELMVQVISLCSIVAIGYLTRSIWALVAGGLITAALQCLLTHTVLKGPRPRLRLESSAVRELISKGKWILASSLLGFIALSGDRMLLGGLIDSATLGLYSIAFGLASIAPAAFSAILSRVVFPALSEVVRDRPAELRGTYRRFQQITDAFVGFLAGLLFISSDAIIAFLYDPRYHNAGSILAFLAIGSVGMRVVVIEQIYLATGQPSLLALAAVPRAATLLIGVPIGFAVAQLNGALVAIVLSQFAHWPLAIWYRWRKALNDIRNDIVLPVAIAFGWAVGWLGLRLLSLLQDL